MHVLSTFCILISNQVSASLNPSQLSLNQFPIGYIYLLNLNMSLRFRIHIHTRILFFTPIGIIPIH